MEATVSKTIPFKQIGATFAAKEQGEGDGAKVRRYIGNK